MFASPANAGLVAACQDLSHLYFTDGNPNAGKTYTKIVATVKDFDYAVTEKNALGLGKGKT
jgi:hypothetical protein